MFRRLIASTVVAITVIGGCSPSSPTPRPSESAAQSVEASPGPAGGFPDDVFTTPPIVFDLGITTDHASAAVGSIGPDGGQLSAQAADGTTYTLEIPPGALLFPEDIAMTPIVEAEGLPGDSPPEHTAGVELEPDGLELFVPATLRITPPSPLPEAGVATFSFYDDGEDAGLVLFDQAASEIAVSVAHFSGVASFWPLDVVWWEGTLRLRRAAVAQDFRATIGMVLAQERQNQLFGLGDLPWDKLLSGFDRWVLDPLLRAAPLGCLEASTAVTAYAEWDRQMQLLGVSLKNLLPEEYNRATEAQRELDAKMRREPPPELMALAFDLCSEEKYQRCLTTGDFEALQRFFLGYIRQQELLGFEVPDSVITRAKSFLDRCGRWELTVESIEDFNTPIGERASIHQTRTYPIRWKPGDAAVYYGLASLATGEGATEIVAATARNPVCPEMLNVYEGTAPPDQAVIQRLIFKSGEYVTVQWVVVPDRGDGVGVIAKVEQHEENDPRPQTVELGFTFGDQTWRFLDTATCSKFTTDRVSTIPAGFPLSGVLPDEMKRRKENWRFDITPFSAELTITKTFTTTTSTGIQVRTDVEAILTLVHTPAN